MTTYLIKVLGDLFENEALCTHIVVTKRHDLKLLINLQTVIALGTSEMKTQAIWLLSNIVLNSLPDLKTVLETGILSNVAMACRD